MSDPTNAVFLSYASQDAEAAKRIADALRAAGVEVWFDQNELVGGDAWDAKIRKQIAECALFVPIISANTQARLEGYFRLEWKIAAQRTHTMADERVFLLPVVIDDTRDAEARVPAEFKAVQWTRLPGGEAMPAFCVRVKKLLDGGTVVESAPTQSPAATTSAAPRGKRTWQRYGWTAIGLLFAFIYALRPMFREPRTQPGKPAVESAPTTEVRRLTQQARELIIKSGRGSSKWEAASLLCERALALDPTDAEALALASQVDSRLWFHVFDRTPRRSEGARTRAARALDLAPTAYESRLAQATFLVLVAGQPQSEQTEPVLRQLRLEKPSDPRAVNLLASLMMSLQRYDEGLALHDDEARIPGNEAYGLTQKAWSLHRLRRIAEMETALDRSIALQPIAGSVTLRVYYDLGWWGDNDRALASLNRLPAEELAEDNGITAAVRVHRWRRDPEALLRFLAAVPRDWIWWGIRGPKAALTGDAHAAAGRMIAARTDWQSGIALVERRLAESPNDQNLLEWKAYLHARLGDTAAARDAYQRSLESVPIEHGLLEIEKLGYIAPEEDVLGELERRAENTMADLGAKRRMSARFISASDLRLNPAWDPVRAHPRFQALLARLDADPRFNPKAERAAAEIKTDDKSVAVLPFENRSASGEDSAFLADGVHEDLINTLSRVPGLKVISRTAVERFRGAKMPMADIAAALRVTHLVEASVQRAGSQVRVNVQLVQTVDGQAVWSERYDRILSADGIFALQEEITAAVAQALQLRLAPERVAKLVAGTTKNMEAYEAFLKGRQIWKTPGGSDREAVVQFQRAVALDPDFALAHGAMAEAYITLGNFGHELPGEIYPLAKAAAERALAIDPRCIQALTALGEYAFHYEWDWDKADRLLRDALRVDPNYTSAYDRLSGHLTMMNREAEAKLMDKRRDELEPASPFGRLRGQLREQLQAKNYSAAVVTARQLAAAASGSALGSYLLGSTLRAAGLFSESVPLLEKAVHDNPNDVQLALELGLNYAASNQPTKTREVQSRLNVIRETRYIPPLIFAQLAAAQHDRDLAFAEIERAFQLHDSNLPTLPLNDDLASLRGDPRYRDTLRRLKLDTAFPEPMKQ